MRKSKSQIIKPKRVKLSKFEMELLEYPPTEGTWLCEQDHINARAVTECVWCRHPKPEKARLLWPQYVKACEKLQLTPGEGYWKKVDEENAKYWPRGGKRWVDCVVPFEGEPTLVVQDLSSSVDTDEPVVSVSSESSTVRRKKSI